MGLVYGTHDLVFHLGELFGEHVLFDLCLESEEGGGTFVLMVGAFEVALLQSGTKITVSLLRVICLSHDTLDKHLLICLVWLVSRDSFLSSVESGHVLISTWLLSSISTDHLNVIWLLLDNLTVLLESFVLVLEEAVCSDEHVEFILQKLSLFITVKCVLTLLFLLLTIVKIVLELTQLSSEVLSLHGTSFA